MEGGGIKRPLPVSPSAESTCGSTVTATEGSQVPGEARHTAAERRQARVRKMGLLKVGSMVAAGQAASQGMNKTEDGDMLETEGTTDALTKKQQRMIRNRESAALSRKRKRDQVEALQLEVKQLKEKNRQLKLRLSRYEVEMENSRSYPTTSTSGSGLLSTPQEPTAASAGGAAISSTATTAHARGVRQRTQGPSTQGTTPRSASPPTVPSVPLQQQQPPPQPLPQPPQPQPAPQPISSPPPAPWYSLPAPPLEQQAEAAVPEADLQPPQQDMSPVQAGNGPELSFENYPSRQASQGTGPGGGGGGTAHPHNGGRTVYTTQQQATTSRSSQLTSTMAFSGANDLPSLVGGGMGMRALSTDSGISLASSSVKAEIGDDVLDILPLIESTSDFYYGTDNKTDGGGGGYSSDFGGLMLPLGFPSQRMGGGNGQGGSQWGGACDNNGTGSLFSSAAQTMNNGISAELSGQRMDRGEWDLYSGMGTGDAMGQGQQPAAAWVPSAPQWGPAGALCWPQQQGLIGAGFQQQGLYGATNQGLEVPPMSRGKGTIVDGKPWAQVSRASF